MENKIYQIRYNTNSTKDNERWRLLENGNEILVSDVIIDGNTYTTKDWILEINDYKWHISCKGVLKLENNVAHIKTEKKENTIARHLAKTITWRIVGTIDTTLISWLLTGNLKIGLAIGGTEVITKMILYFIHERVWYKFVKTK
jgi:uncharacterized membrane protein